MTHTPGPWDYVEDGPDFLAIMAPGDFQVAAVGVDDNSTADARLIVAAPDLLAACKAALAVFTTPTMPAKDVQRSHEALEAAILKAEGAE